MICTTCASEMKKSVYRQGEKFIFACRACYFQAVQAASDAGEKPPALIPADENFIPLVELPGWCKLED